jgi:hypothetical protein
MSSLHQKAKIREKLSQYFHLPIMEAAKQLGVCATVLKKICRKNGINRWPHRKVRSIDKSISVLKSSLSGNDSKEDERIQEEIKKLEHQRELIMKYPNICLKRRRTKSSITYMSTISANPNFFEDVVSHPSNCKVSYMEETQNENNAVVFPTVVSRPDTISVQGSSVTEYSNFSTGSPDISGTKEGSFPNREQFLISTYPSNRCYPTERNYNKEGRIIHPIQSDQAHLPNECGLFMAIGSRSQNTSISCNSVVTSPLTQATPSKSMPPDHNLEVLHQHNNHPLVELPLPSPFQYKLPSQDQQPYQNQYEYYFVQCWQCHDARSPYYQCHSQCQRNDNYMFSLSTSMSPLVCRSEVKKRMSVNNLLSSNDNIGDDNNLTSQQSDQLSFPEWFQEEKRNYLSITKVPTK